jgi:hypothetical protein
MITTIGIENYNRNLRVVFGFCQVVCNLIYFNKQFSIFIYIKSTLCPRILSLQKRV